MSTSDDNPTDVPMDTADEQIIHKLAQLRADSTRLNRLTSEQTESHTAMDCINARRRELERKTIDCPFPDCDWSTDYDPDNRLSRSIAYHDAEDHPEEHRSELAETDCKESGS